MASRRPASGTWRPTGERDRAYNRAHREEKLARERKRYESTHPEALTGGEVQQRARDLEQAVTDLRAQGLEWTAVAQRLGRSLKSVMMVAQRVRRASGKAKYYRARELEREVVEARAAGFTWAEIAALLDRPAGTCATAHWRATEPEAYNAYYRERYARRLAERKKGAGMDGSG